MGLEVFWYIVIILAIGFYAMLDGFDLGVGCLHLLTKKDIDRRIFLNAIGPVWDGNEVWLVVVVGGLLAGFPNAYATLISGFYIPITLIVFALIFRAVAIEFRSKHESKMWRQSWDISFSVASFLIAIGVGIALGNLVSGIPLGENQDYQGGMLLTFLMPYPLLVGLLVFSIFLMHGAIFLVMKTEGVLQKRLILWVTPTFIFFVMTYAITTMITLIYLPHMTEKIQERPYLFFVVLANMFVIANIPREISRKKMGAAFVCSCLNILLLLTLFAVGTFPNLIRSSIDPENNSLNIANTAASQTTFTVLAIIVAIGIPLVLAYFYYIYRVFHGKVKVDHMSY